MAPITVWSKQHMAVLEELETTGRYTAKRAYIEKDLEEHAGLVLQAYDWYADRASRRCPKPADVVYPVWVSYLREATMLPGPGHVILELEIDEACVMPVNIGKWGTILNFSYIPADEADRRAHEALLSSRGIYDAKAFMTPFYPDIKRTIIESWERLFDPDVIVNNTDAYGTVWELRREWIKAVLR